MDISPLKGSFTGVKVKPTFFSLWKIGLYNLNKLASLTILTIDIFYTHTHILHKNKSPSQLIMKAMMSLNKSPAIQEKLTNAVIDHSPQKDG